MGHGCFCGPSLYIASASGYRCHSWRSEILGRAEDLTVPWTAAKWQWRWQRLATGQCCLQNSWDASWAHDNLMTVVCCKNTGKRWHVEGMEFRGMAKAIRRCTGIGTGWGITKGVLYTHMHCRMVCVGRHWWCCRTFYMLQPFTQQVICNAFMVMGLDEMNWVIKCCSLLLQDHCHSIPIAHWSIFLLKAIKFYPPTTLSGRLFHNLLHLLVRSGLLITSLNVFMVSLHQFVPVSTFSFS